MHELGHVLGAWLTGGEVWRVVLHPLSISRTDLGANPHPLAVVWAGPMLGVAIPGLLWGAAAGLQTAWSRRRRGRRERGGGAVGFALVWTCLARSRKTTADLPCALNSRTMVTQPLRAEPNLVRTGICGARKG